MLPPKMRSRRRKCKHCDKVIGAESVKLTHRRGSDKHTLEFCSSDCMVEHLYDEQIRGEIDREVRKELNWLHKQVCPACRRRIT